MSRTHRSVRLFAALLPPPACTAALAGWARENLAGPGVRLLEPDGMHLTIAFLGERPLGELAGLRATIEELDAPAPRLSLGAPLLLPSRGPRTVAVEVGESDEELAALQRRAVALLAAASAWEPPRRRFRPHITVARLRRGSRAPESLPATPAVSFTPLALELLRSDLRPEGAVYEPLASCPLEPSPDARSVRRDG